MKKNYDLPAYPETKTSHEYGTTNDKRWDYGNVYSVGGLTKLELASFMAMQGLLSSVQPVDAKWIAENSIVCAKELLSQLDNEK